jgi:hypothetical protein
MHQLPTFGLFALVGALGTASCRKPPDSQIEAVHLRPANSKFADAFSPADISALLVAISTSEAESIQIISSSSNVVAEPPVASSAIPVNDMQIVGYGASKFLAHSKWATIRYRGPSSGIAADPAGAGLTSTAQDQAQIAALGKENDSIPVVTAAWTITKMMDEYFAPILSGLPYAGRILSQTHIQGAYFAPGFTAPDLQIERDNAFMVGLQSLYLWPSSCHGTTNRLDCKAPYMSTGHDPTVVAHELTHAIFNHIRGGQSIDGFQWVAVNEGYADYFSAAFFSEPKIGRIWKVSTTQKSLRVISQARTTEDAALQLEAHQFSMVWSSALWRIRARLIAENKANTFDVDKMILHSISYLGESSKIRLGDAGTSLLKAAEVLDRTLWKAVIRAELDAAEVALLQAPTNALDATTVANITSSQRTSQSSNPVCGAISARNYTAGLLAAIAPLLAVLLRLFFGHRRLKR